MWGSNLAVAGVLACAALVGGCDDYGNDAADPPAELGHVTVVATGVIAPTVDEFRLLLGDRNGGNVGPQATGRREIGWDGVPEQFNNADNAFPADFFNTNVKLGAIFATNGTGFRNDSTLFRDLHVSNGDQFTFFSATKTFASTGGNIVDVWMQVPGQPTPGVSTGFGAVFVDVDNENESKLEFFRRDGTSLGSYAAPVRSDESGLSFVGVKFDSAVVARVRITLGDAVPSLGVPDLSEGGGLDLVVLDDFIYGEPQAAF